MYIKKLFLIYKFNKKFSQYDKTTKSYDNIINNKIPKHKSCNKKRYRKNNPRQSI